MIIDFLAYLIGCIILFTLAWLIAPEGARWTFIYGAVAWHIIHEFVIALSGAIDTAYSIKKHNREHHD